ncbi:Arm DNA-binding domain-containing protein [Lentilactobacillus kisonensis]|uniref:AP2-like integrase N-terminal domain-containing protein n=1 Tax=Lentilactobacillus kisonensis F0435 TaxID=797516 RepID=H1LGX1_9LACO|nr:Arm DNA-binding domain-containing protein [Lentilactobacillus kisonensis]EHO50751.1 hypothetical protein HMPREF9104_01852 [Lentilactobacillus kisonensis F0435]
MVSINKQGKLYQVRYSYKDINDRQYTKNKSGFRTKQDAQLYALQAIVDVNNRLALSLKQMTFAEYFDYWYKTYKMQSLQNDY